MLKRLCLFVVCLMVLSMSANADTIVLRNGLDGYAGVQDTDISDYGGNRVFNYGQNAHIGYTEGASGLVKWDLSALGGVTINSATVQVWGLANGYPDYAPGTDVVALLPANSDWIEGTGTGGVAALPGEVTWSYRQYDTVLWAGSPGAMTPGVDHDPTILANFVVAGNTGTGPVGPYTFELPVELVQGWINDSGNNAGLMFSHHDRAPANPWTWTSLASSQYGDDPDDIHRPQLTIDYVPEPATMTMLLLGGLLLRRRR